MRRFLMPEKIIVGMSGGVDSSVAAYLLKEKGWDPVGVTMVLYGGDDSPAARDAAIVAEYIGIPHFTVDFREIFEDAVVEYFVNEYVNGRTPNPCVMCNKFIKFDALHHWGKGMGINSISTGHYVGKHYEEDTDRWALRKAVDYKKDQSYFMCMLSQSQLELTEFPLADLTKPQVREIAKSVGLPSAGKSESQDICFLPDGDYQDYILKRYPKADKPGDFVDADGNVLGRHKGIIYYTIGQRKGLGLALGYPAYVTKLDIEKNQVVMGRLDDLFSEGMMVSGVNWMAIAGISEPIRAAVKTRYTKSETDATIYPISDTNVRVVFDEPVRAVTPGQSAAFYRDGVLLGGGVIDGKYKI